MHLMAVDKVETGLSAVLFVRFYRRGYAVTARSLLLC